MNRMLTRFALAAVSIILAACSSAATPVPTAAPTAAPAASASAAASATAEPKWTGPLDKVTLRLDWFVNGTHAMYFVGRSTGIYAAQGIDLTIGEGKGSGSTAQIIGSGGDMFGICDISTAAVAADKGAPIAAIATFDRTTTMDITVLASSGITKPADLKGKKIGGTPASAAIVLLPAFLKANGMTMSDVTVVNVDAAATQQALVEGRIDGIAEFTVSQAPVVEIVLGKKVNLVKFADFGVNQFGVGLITNTSLIKSNPDLVRRFVRASIESWAYAQKNSDEAVQAAVANAASGSNADVFKIQMQRALESQDTPNTKNVPAGTMVKADIDQTVGLLQQYLGMSATFNTSAFFVNDYLPK